MRVELVAGAGLAFGLNDTVVPLRPHGLGIRALVPTLPGTRDIELGADWRRLSGAFLEGFDFTRISDERYDRLRFTLAVRFRKTTDTGRRHGYMRLGIGLELHDIELTTVYDASDSEDPSYQTQRASARAAVATFGFGRSFPGRVYVGLELELALGRGYGDESTFVHEPQGTFGELQFQLAFGGNVW